ncbi:PhoPQ-regulated protein [Luteitalea sp. TBR-22]|uniref:PhoPQ-activated pathogenicity-related family protein n=1 Tax=Luteitalea sp. TBR-22 TaxID=2802971 RepID=UPI001AFBF654|nr:PhoPQ-activated pathogenicity-related family protein [Luteitalea sp. TBR-22]BCS35754.1 PhoPQ-regulated protein [Luteitalea sp. TBR-22]
MSIRLLSTALLGLLATAVPSLAQPLRVPLADASATSLDRYVATPDPAYKWAVVGTRQEGTLVVTTIEMTSQTWRKPGEVDRTEWKHYLTVIRPETVESDTSLLFIAGGGNDRPATPKTDAMLAAIAARTKTIVTELRMIPNQPLTFFNDGVARKEDDLIAYGWRKFLDGGDDQWLARFPMTKAAVRAMDTVQAFAQSPEGGRRAITKFVVSGGSKRGWTTWTTAAVDSRVVAIMPAVIDVLNMRPSMIHHYRAYGFWAPAVGDYVTHGIMDRMNDPRFDKLLALVEPYSYRNRLTIPKYIINASGDQFFLPDSWQFYFDDLKGEKYLRYTPNADHSLKGSNAPTDLLGFYASIVRNTPRPKFTWKAGKDGVLEIAPETRPTKVTFWQATNPNARDFRVETLGAVWKGTPVEPDASGVYRAKVEAPGKGFTAGFLEVVFDVGGPAPLTFSTGVRVMPDVLPFAAPRPGQPAVPSQP